MGEMSLCPGLTSSQEDLCGRTAGYVEMAGAGSSLPLTFQSQQLHLPSPVCPVAPLVGQNLPQKRQAVICSRVCCRFCFLRAGSGQANWGGTSRNPFPDPLLHCLLVTSSTTCLHRCLVLWLLPSSLLGWCVKKSSLDDKSCILLGLCKPAHIF